MSILHRLSKPEDYAMKRFLMIAVAVALAAALCAARSPRASEDEAAIRKLIRAGAVE
jgi:hypothetical protein